MTMQIVFITSWFQFSFSNKISYIYLFILFYEFITPNRKHLSQCWMKILVRSEKSFPVIRIHGSAFLLKQYPGVSLKHNINVTDGTPHELELNSCNLLFVFMMWKNANVHHIMRGLIGHGCKTLGRKITIHIFTSGIHRN